MTAFPVRVDVVGTPISLTSYDEIIDLIRGPSATRPRVIAVCNVHSVVTARREESVRRALASADVATPDGMPLVWAINAMHACKQTRVYGPELMRRALRADTQLRHYLYGSTEATLERLRANLALLAPDANIVGWNAPPFRELTEREKKKTVAEIASTNPDLIWVGLGMPKQELWMAEFKDLFPASTLIGVGAAFDILAGNLMEAPGWMQRAGLEWLFRLIQEPGRLWRRYMTSNPAYLFLATWQVLRYRIGERTRPGSPSRRS